MNYSTFVLFISALPILVILDYIAGALPLHPDKMRFDAVKLHLSQRSPAFVGAYSIVSSLFVLLFIGGFIGLYFLIPIAPIVFAIGCIGKFLHPLLIPVENEKSVYERFISDFQIFLEGAILAILFLGPARPLFV